MELVNLRNWGLPLGRNFNNLGFGTQTAQPGPMITEATTTQNLIATITNARPLGTVSFEEGCTVLDAIELFDRRVAGGKLGTWLTYGVAGQNALRFFPAGNTPEDQWARQHMCKLLALDVTWKLSLDMLDTGAPFTAWIVIDRATHAVWVECSPVKDGRVLHPRALREACEFPSSSRGTVSVYAFLRKGAPWSEVRDSMTETYYEAQALLDLLELLPRGNGTVSSTASNASNGAGDEVVDLHVTNGAVGIRTSQLTKPVHIRMLTVTGKDSVGIDLDDGDSK